MTKHQTLTRIEASGVVAVVRAPGPDVLPALTDALLAGGVVAIEVTMTTPRAIHAIEKLADSHGDRAVVGVGTVLDAATAAAAIHAGAQFVVSPVLDRGVIETTLKYGKVSVPGAYTPTEVLAAFAAGGDVIKIFPATTLGPGYLKDLRGPMPQLRLTPTGGVTVENAGDWIRAGAVCIGAGSDLCPKEAIAKGDWGEITRRAKQFTEAVSRARGA
ncbi:MAG: bifunctional 4-hydroxy-2-oxoglutarate aldolase/2-dehydro-3-deoxy-phosphogluconate aldolase [Phycisphaerae bacterium]